MHPSVLVVFDFDHTISNDNTDIIARKLLPQEKLTDNVKELYRTSGWIPYMAKIFELLHSSLIDSKQIERAIIRIPSVPGIETLLKELHVRGCEIIIISDSNTLFIGQWLRNKKLDHIIAQVFTNPARVDDNGVIRIDMYHVQDSCKLSTVNLCKGQILESYMKQRKNEGVNFDRVAYVGDGKNDLCPSLRLTERDFVFPRQNYTLIKILDGSEKMDIPKMRARVFPWSNGMQILEKLKEEVFEHPL
ncbi:putative phosphatase phospho2 [Lasioglossum baleicum]|uniref:putative phosphatase phospho2 n=1 Tax=Lasioglossum baleicum TaxID=434251 RepID=UPI003FCC5E45